MGSFIKRIMNSPWEQRIFPICLVLGVIFLILSNTHRTKQTKEPESEEVICGTTYEEQLESRLENALSMLEGVGRVKVMVTCKDQGKILVEKDTSYNSTQTVEEDASGGSRVATEEEKEETVIYDENSHPFVKQEESPAILGVLVLAEGADSSIIQQQLMQSVSVLLNLKASQIQVLPYQNELSP